MTKGMSWLAAGSVLLAAAACDQTGPVAPEAADHTFAAALVGGLPNGAPFQVIACKDGPTGSYDFTASTTTGSPSGTTVLTQGSNFSLTAGAAATECAVVATSTSSLQNVTVAEVVANLPSDVVFEKVIVHKWFTGTGDFVSHVESSSASQTVQFGNDFGYVLEFVNVPAPSTGCTLTLGYWKTHNDSFEGGAPTDVTWDLVGPLAEQELFYGTGKTWFEIFWTAPAGNAYFNLAHQYMAAVLNTLAGASAPQAVLDAIDHADDLFTTYSIAYVGDLKGKNSIRKDFIDTAGILGAYNEGITGPGHCGD